MFRAGTQAHWLLAGSGPIMPTACQHNAWLYQLLLGKWPTWRTNSFLCIYFFIYNSLHVSSTSCSSSGETNCINI